MGKTQKIEIEVGGDPWSTSYKFDGVPFGHMSELHFEHRADHLPEVRIVQVPQDLRIIGKAEVRILLGVDEWTREEVEILEVAGKYLEELPQDGSVGVGWLRRGRALRRMAAKLRALMPEPPEVVVQEGGDEPPEVES